MRHNQNRRSRGRSRKGPNPLARSYESNGPDVKVRGNAAHVAEKYMTLARDAQAAGDVVAAENYLQHAEHYNRIVMAAQAQFHQSQPQFREEEGYDDERPVNGRGMRDRFESNGYGRDEDGDERFEGEFEDDRFRPMPVQGRDQSRAEQGRSDQGRPDQGRSEQGQGERQRAPRDRFERRERPEYRESREPRADRLQQDEQPESEQPSANVAPAADEQPAPSPRRRRGRPRSENVEAADESGDTTPDGAAALAAFPD